jgi:hypothetical protein
MGSPLAPSVLVEDFMTTTSNDLAHPLYVWNILAARRLSSAGSWRKTQDTAAAANVASARTGASLFARAP